MRNESESLFTYETGKSFSEFENCDGVYDSTFESSVTSAPTWLIDICGDDIGCIIDGLNLGPGAAADYLVQLASFPTSESCILDEMAYNVRSSSTFFGGGADFPAGDYQVQYADGCFTVGNGRGWVMGLFASLWRIVTPSTAYPFGAGAGRYFGSYNQCVAENKRIYDASVNRFSHEGGRIYMALSDPRYGDNRAGPSAPTFILLGPCPIAT